MVLIGDRESEGRSLQSRVDYYVVPSAFLSLYQARLPYHSPFPLISTGSPAFSQTTTSLPPLPSLSRSHSIGISFIWLSNEGIHRVYATNIEETLRKDHRIATTC